MGAPPSAGLVTPGVAGRGARVPRARHAVTNRGAAGRLSAVSIAETLLVYVGIPSAVVAVLALWTLRPDSGTRRTRYRPGQPWEQEPVWYLPHAEHTSSAGHGPAAGATALEAGARQVGAGGPLGGARGTW